jgi:hypothetical protein
MAQEIVTPWEYPEVLIQYVEGVDRPSTGYVSPAQQRDAAICRELRRQHEAVQFLLEQQLLGSVYRGRQDRVEVAEGGS